MRHLQQGGMIPQSYTSWTHVSRVDPVELEADGMIVKIKYPPDNQPPRSIKSRPSDAASEKTINDRGMIVTSPPLNERAVNLPSGNSPPKPRHEESPPLNLHQQHQHQQQQQQQQRGVQPSNSMDSISQTASPPMSMDRLAQIAQAPREADNEVVDLAPPIRPPNGPPTAVGTSSGPPQRPRREGDEEYRRAMSPPNGPPSPTNPTHRVTSPTHAHPASPPSAVKNGFNPSILGTRSPSPRLRMSDGEKPVPPADAFYYGRSPTANGFSNRPGSMQGSTELVKELKSKDAELDAGKKREAALRVILGKAMQQGFVADEDVDMPEQSGEEDEDLVGKLTDALVRLKHEKAAIQVSCPLP